MSSTKPRAAATDEELSKLFEGIDDDGSTSTPVKTEKKSISPSKPAQDATAQSEQDILAELGNLAAERPASRSQTPKLAPMTATSKTAIPTKANPAVESLHIRQASDSSQQEAGRRSRNSAENSSTSRTETQPAKTSSTSPGAASGGGGGWWGGLVATASAAVKTAEAAVKEIQQNEEAKRWTEQVKGNVGALRGLGDELRSRALPTFTNILHTLAPPISAHERLQIHITHDLIGYPSLDPLIYQTFSRVMAQVEGGDLLVIQRGQESAPKQHSEGGLSFSGAGGWADGPWWRQPVDQRSLGIVKGVVEGTKLVRASVESYSNDFYLPLGGVESASKKDAESMSETNPVRNSHIFIGIQALGLKNAQDIFAAGGVQQHETGDQQPSSHNDDEKSQDELVGFAIYLFDPEHGIKFSTLTQTFPMKWAEWMDVPSPNPVAPSSSLTKEPNEGISRSSQEGNRAGEDVKGLLPEEIATIIREGGADPREWVAEWIEETLSLGVGIVAQRYVARRMGVGEGVIGQAKARQQALDSGAGEAARAI
ncbi:MAG: hypothetical protein M1823_004217 [Watsoniomyces obsoletus]|nr:MAG: hypothetical protein M1823_004217 [Watsoniomyces obsoletus]